MKIETYWFLFSARSPSECHYIFQSGGAWAATQSHVWAFVYQHSVILFFCFFYFLSFAESLSIMLSLKLELQQSCISSFNWFFPLMFTYQQLSISPQMSRTSHKTLDFSFFSYAHCFHCRSNIHRKSISIVISHFNMMIYGIKVSAHAVLYVSIVPLCSHEVP